jgi:hypothetical protein
MFGQRLARWSLFGLLLASLAASSGCGSSRVGKVSGKVLLDGNLVAGGTVTFLDAGHNAVSGVIKEDGSYTVDGVAVGTAKISVGAPQNKNPFAGRQGRRGKPVGTALVPEHYKNPEKSGLTYDVRAGEQEHDIELDP